MAADTESFRNELGVLEKDGKRKKMYPRHVSGKFYTLRTILGVGLLALMFAGPFLKVNGHPLMLFNILERKFIVFGIAFFPQDLYLFALTLLTFIVFIVLFTVVFGRLFCGWACPQTIFMEMVFRRIEYWIEGDASQQKKLDASPWNTEKIIKRGSKHLIFFLISFLIANTFLAYLIGIDELEKLIIDTPVQHIGNFIALIIFTLVFYTVFAYVRELVCIVICPYGRLQSVLLDNNSIVVAYDFIRGEPRGKLQKHVKTENIAPVGDCVDCKLCVQVCPTGIDIRNGTQLECVNCTACMDACDEVMIKIEKPEGLIRYASMNGIKQGAKKIFTPRVIGYSAVLVVLISLTSFLLLSRSPMQMTVLRTPGMLYQEIDRNTIGNLYSADFVNKTFDDMVVEIRLKSGPGMIKMIGTDSKFTVPKQNVLKATFFIQVPKDKIQVNNTPFVIEAFVNGIVVSQTKTSFIAPVK
jgi:cytochrome c oxidase accessory protein FixG